MAEITRLSDLQRRLDEYRAAESAILGGAQSYQIGSRRLDRAQLSKISEMIAYLEQEIAKEQSKMNGKGRIKTIGVIPRDF